MKERYDEYDEIEAKVAEEESNGVFTALREFALACPVCDYTGSFLLKRAGYICPECRELVLPL